MGKLPAYVQAAKWVSSDITPTKTVYTYQEAGMEIKLSFLTPLLVEDLDLVTRPLSYASWSFTATDKKSHAAEIYFDISGLASVDKGSQAVTFGKQSVQQLEVLKIGSKETACTAKERRRSPD